MNKGEIRVTEQDLYKKYLVTDEASDWQNNALKLVKVKTFNLIKKEQAPLKGKLILNVGCGRDVLFQLFNQEGAEIFEFDLVIDALREIGDKGANNLIAGDIFRIPIKSESFDSVFCTGVLHHLHPLELPLSEMVRVLKKGGRIYCVEPSRDYLPSMIIESTGQSLAFRIRESILPVLFNKYSAPAYYERTLSSQEIESLLKKLGCINLSRLFDNDSHFVLPKVFAVCQSPLIKILKKLPVSVSKHFAFEFTVKGERQ